MFALNAAKILACQRCRLLAAGFSPRGRQRLIFSFRFARSAFRLRHASERRAISFARYACAAARCLRSRRYIYDARTLSFRHVATTVRYAAFWLIRFRQRRAPAERHAFTLSLVVDMVSRWLAIFRLI